MGVRVPVSVYCILTVHGIGESSVHDRLWWPPAQGLFCYSVKDLACQSVWDEKWSLKIDHNSLNVDHDAELN